MQSTGNNCHPRMHPPRILVSIFYALFLFCELFDKAIIYEALYKLKSIYFFQYHVKWKTVFTAPPLAGGFGWLALAPPHPSFLIFPCSIQPAGHHHAVRGSPGICSYQLELLEEGEPVPSATSGLTQRPTPSRHWINV